MTALIAEASNQPSSMSCFKGSHTFEAAALWASFWGRLMFLLLY